MSLKQYNFCVCQRRTFIKLTLTSLPLWFSFHQFAQASITTEALVLSCIDFRFVDMTTAFLKEKQLNQKYDLLTLAGASLALTNFPSEAVTKTFWEQLYLSVKLHNIEKVVILDHQDCGAYATKIDAGLSNNLIREIATHRQYLNYGYKAIKEHYPNLEVELYFLKLDGQVERIFPDLQADDSKTIA